jgi:hypothetical protein
LRKNKPQKILLNNLPLDKSIKITLNKKIEIGKPEEGLAF